MSPGVVIVLAVVTMLGSLRRSRAEMLVNMKRAATPKDDGPQVKCDAI